MCWFMAYYEVKIRPRGNTNSHLEECYRRVNMLEKTRWFQIEPFEMRGRVMYSLSAGQCACDFFKVINGRHGEESRQLRGRLREFVQERMNLPCLEPCLVIAWLDGESGMPGETVLTQEPLTLSFEEFDSIFQKNNPAGAYRFYRQVGQ